MREMGQVVREMRIVCFGDSVTRGITFLKGRLRIVKESYPAILQQLIGEGNGEVLNKGVFNDNSTLMVERLESDVIEQQPDFVLVEVGGNDCNFDWAEVAKRPDEDHEPIVLLNDYLNNLRQIVENVTNAGITPILMTVLPLDPVRYYAQIMLLHGKNIAHWIATCGGIEHWHGNYNRQLRNLMKEMNVLSIDLRSRFKQAGNLDDLLSDDGIHPSRAGYKAMAEIIRDELGNLGIIR